jgi:hypothetical protein
LRDAVVTELRKLVVSESFMSPRRAGLSELRSVVGEIYDHFGRSPMPVFAQSGSAREVLVRAWSLAAGHIGGHSCALGEAVEEVVTLSLLLDGMLLNAVPSIVKGYSNGPPCDAEIKAALSGCLRPLKECAQRAGVQLEANRGFDVFDAAKSTGPSLDLFLSRWRAFRAGTAPVAVDEFADAIIAKDLARLGALIGGREAAKIRVCVSTFPPAQPLRGEGRRNPSIRPTC